MQRSSELLKPNFSVSTEINFLQFPPPVLAGTRRMQVGHGVEGRHLEAEVIVAVVAIVDDVRVKLVLHIFFLWNQQQQKRGASEMIESWK